MMHHCPFKQFGLGINFREEDLIKAWKTRCLQEHPDKVKPEHRAAATIEFQKTSASHTVLKDEDLRELLISVAGYNNCGKRKFRMAWSEISSQESYIELIQRCPNDEAFAAQLALIESEDKTAILIQTREEMRVRRIEAVNRKNEAALRKREQERERIRKVGLNANRKAAEKRHAGQKRCTAKGGGDTSYDSLKDVIRGLEAQLEMEISKRSAAERRGAQSKRNLDYMKQLRIKDQKNLKELESTLSEEIKKLMREKTDWEDQKRNENEELQIQRERLVFDRRKLDSEMEEIKKATEIEIMKSNLAAAEQDKAEFARTLELTKIDLEDSRKALLESQLIRDQLESKLGLVNAQQWETKLAIDKRKFTCSVCGKDVLSQDALTRHIKAHDPQTPCRVCGKLFARKDSLKKHLLTHESNINENPLKPNQIGTHSSSSSCTQEN